MKWLLAAAAAATLASAAFGASAATTVLTFEGVGDEASINNFYNGGTDSAGDSGVNYGISFTSDSLGIIEDSAGGTGNFSNPPSGKTVAFFLSGAGDTMNVAAGFDTGFSFYYADQVGFTGNVSVFDGLGGTGSLLATLSLPSTPNPYTVFVPVGVTFAGTAKSVVFGGAANYIAFDDITLGSATAGGGAPAGVPEPATWTMLLAGFGGIGALMRRRRSLARLATA